MKKMNIIDLIGVALKSKGKEWLQEHGIKEVSFDGDHKSCEVILVVEDSDGHQEYVISDRAVRLLE